MFSRWCHAEKCFPLLLTHCTVTLAFPAVGTCFSLHSKDFERFSVFVTQVSVVNHEISRTSEQSVGRQSILLRRCLVGDSTRGVIVIRSEGG